MDNLENLESIGEYGYERLLLRNKDEIVEEFTKCKYVDDDVKKELLESLENE